MNEIDEAPSENSFRLAGDLGTLMGDLERFELAITLEGDQEVERPASVINWPMDLRILI